MKKVNNYLWGILLIILGIVLGLNSFGITNINILFKGWWTLLIIIPCLINLFDEKEGKVGNIIGLVIGVFLLLGVRGIVDFILIWKLIVPVILVLIGLFVIFKDNFNNKIKEEIIKNTSNEYCATFGEQNIDLSNITLTNYELSAIFGSLNCDLRNSKINKDIKISILSLFGSTTINVPDNVNIVVKSIPIFGNIKNSVIKNEKAEKTIYIEAVCIFGGVDIK